MHKMCIFVCSQSCLCSFFLDVGSRNPKHVGQQVVRSGRHTGRKSDRCPFSEPDVICIQRLDAHRSIARLDVWSAGFVWVGPLWLGNKGTIGDYEDTGHLANI